MKKAMLLMTSVVLVAGNVYADVPPYNPDTTCVDVPYQYPTFSKEVTAPGCTATYMVKILSCRHGLDLHRGGFIWEDQQEVKTLLPDTVMCSGTFPNTFNYSSADNAGGQYQLDDAVLCRLKGGRWIRFDDGEGCGDALGNPF
jgi:hypothetical protein